jgi:hypothetical protein
MACSSSEERDATDRKTRALMQEKGVMEELQEAARAAGMATLRQSDVKKSWAA